VKVRIILIALLATLVGTAHTLYALHNLLAPVTLTFLALREYLSKKTLPSLPTKFTDEAGILMADTSHTINKLDEVIQYMVNYDDLTGLPNRVLFRDRLQQALSQAQSNNQLFALISLSLDRLNNINNTLGRNTGDLLLRSAAQRLATCIGDIDVLAHFGSNKFAILQPNLTSINDAITLSQNILNTLSKSVLLDGNVVRTGTSIGIAIYPSDCTDVDQLLKNADTALYQTKRQGSNNYQFYSAELNANLQERLTLENELHDALNGEKCYYTISLKFP
jgi:diguanylate cyclase (GGDEF)-like protein